MLEGLIDGLAGLPPALQYATLAVLSALENVFPPVPADVAVALGAFLSQRGATSPIALGILCWAANVTSAAGVYWLGRHHGAALAEARWVRPILTPEAMRALQAASERHGVLGIFASRFLPGFRAAVPPFAGMVGMSPLRALLPMAVASAIWYGCLVAAGTALGLSWDAVRALIEGAQHLLGAVALVVLVGVALWLLRARRVGR